MSKVRQRIPDLQLIKRLHLMADTGGMLSNDRTEAVRQAADRIDEYAERIAMMTEHIVYCRECVNYNAGEGCCTLLDFANIDGNWYCADGERKVTE